MGSWETAHVTSAQSRKKRFQISEGQGHLFHQFIMKFRLN